MSQPNIPLTDNEHKMYDELNQENIDFLMTRYNRVNRW
jgi:hypothetical protein